MLGEGASPLSANAQLQKPVYTLDTQNTISSYHLVQRAPTTPCCLETVQAAGFCQFEDDGSVITEQYTKHSRELKHSLPHGSKFHLIISFV